MIISNCILLFLSASHPTQVKTENINTTANKILTNFFINLLLCIIIIYFKQKFIDTTMSKFTDNMLKVYSK